MTIGRSHHFLAVQRKFQNSFFFFRAEDGIRALYVTGVQTCALPILGRGLAAPVLLSHGSEELRRRFIRPTVTGEITWCQLFSEPGAGSDLAGLATRAERDGELWRVTGQKVWSTGAATADYGLLLARTDAGVPKHRGITCFVLPMRQAGVEVRPLRQMNGHASFNEVFLDLAEVPAGHVIGDPGGGW